jgi:hypothetical protein
MFVARAMTRRAASAQQQKRGIVDYLTNYPDKVSTPLVVFVLSFHRFKWMLLEHENSRQTNSSFSSDKFKIPLQ